MRTLLIAGTVTLLVALGAPAAAAQHNHSGHGAQQGPGGGHGEMKHCPMHAAKAGGPQAALQHREHLGLSAEQVQRLEALAQRAAEVHRQAMPRMQEIHGEIAAASAGVSFDEAAARVAIERMNQLHAGMMLTMLRTRHEVNAILTPDQRERLAAHASHALGGGHGSHGARREAGGHAHGAMGGEGAGMMQCAMHAQGRQ